MPLMVASKWSDLMPLGQMTWTRTTMPFIQGAVFVMPETVMGLRPMDCSGVGVFTPGAISLVVKMTPEGSANGAPANGTPFAVFV